MTWGMADDIADLRAENAKLRLKYEEEFNLRRKVADALAVAILQNSVLTVEITNLETSHKGLELQVEGMRKALEEIFAHDDNPAEPHCGHCHWQIEVAQKALGGAEKRIEPGPKCCCDLVKAGHGGYCPLH